MLTNNLLVGQGIKTYVPLAGTLFHEAFHGVFGYAATPDATCK
jgi:hypothetical protein